MHAVRHPYRALRGRLGKAGALAVIGLLLAAATAFGCYLAFSGAGGGGSTVIGAQAQGGDTSSAQALTIAATVGAGGAGCFNAWAGMHKPAHLPRHEQRSSESVEAQLSRLADGHDDESSDVPAELVYGHAVVV